MATAAITTDSLGDASVNGGTIGCWSDATPDILPGDTIRVTGPGFTDTAADEAVTTSRAEQTGPGTVVVHGTAAAADGSPLPLATLEARIVGSSKLPFSNGRRDLRAGSTNPFPLVQDAGDPTHWTATFSGLTAADVDTALDAVDVRGISTDAVTGDQTIAQAPVARGPAAPCSAPVRRDALTWASRTAIGAGTAGDDLTLSGVAQDATDVTVTLDDDDPDTAGVTVPAGLSAPSGPQSFSATIPGVYVRALSDGMLTASAAYTVGGTAISGATLSLLKDTVAPPAPVATPGAGTYVGAQSVAIEDADTAATIHWTAGPSAPTAGAAAYATPILVTASQTLRAVAVDRAGNTSPVAAFRFVIAPPAPVAGPTPSGAAAVPGLAVVSAKASAASGAFAPAPLRARGLVAPRRISAARLRAQGLRLAMRVPGDAVIVRVAVYRATAAGRRSGPAVATAIRLAPGADGVVRLRLRDRAFLRRLGHGRYVVEVRVGRSRTVLGPPASTALTVTR